MTNSSHILNKKGKDLHAAWRNFTEKQTIIFNDFLSIIVHRIPSISLLFSNIKANLTSRFYFNLHCCRDLINLPYYL